MLAGPAGIVFDIKRSAVHDGPGIRTTAFLKGCSLRCRWCHSPESQSSLPELMYSAAICTGCGECAGACPRSLLDRGPAQLARSACQVCGCCASACPSGALEIIGWRAEASDVISLLERDSLLYAASGGGVTVSGGEPALQPEFAAAILSGARARGFHTALQTAGHVGWTALETLLRHTDLVLYDLKHAAPARHQSLTGACNDTIIDNLRRVAQLAANAANAGNAGDAGSGAAGPRFIVRVPVIPGLNDDPQDISALARMLAALPALPERVELLPYHNLGAPKYPALGRKYQLSGLEQPSRPALALLAGVIAGFGFNVVEEGIGVDDPE